MEKRDGFIFYSSWLEAINIMDDSDQLLMFKKICSYGIGIDFALPKKLETFWILIKPQMDANIKRYKDGKKGGRPIKKVDNETNNQWLNKNKPKEKDNDKLKEKEKIEHWNSDIGIDGFTKNKN